MERPHLLILSEPHEITLRRMAPLDELTVMQIAKTADQAKLLLPEAEIVFLWESGGVWLRSFWNLATRLKWVHTSGVGVESLLFPEMLGSEVFLTNSRGCYSNALAEFAIAAMLYFAKDIPRLQQNRSARGWDRFLMKEIRGQAVGVLGLGNIGRAVARKAKALGMKVLATKRQTGSLEEVDQLFSRDHLQDLLKNSNYVVNALPLTTETLGMMGREQFRAMEPASYFINVGRGRTVQEASLVEALRENWIAGAALDVFESEPLPPGSEFYTLPNVLISPHCCDLTLSYYENTATLLVDNVKRFLTGERLMNVVDKRLGY